LESGDSGNNLERLTAMSHQLPAITLDQSVDGEYVITASHRVTGVILAVAIGYNCEDVSTKVDMQLIEMGIQIYASSEFY
jgi:hypothetical protein